MEPSRCPWPTGSPVMIRYHDEEWGVPLHDDRKLFEFMVLDAFQAGLSWAIIMKKRAGFRRAFDRFEPRKVAAYNAKKINELVLDEGIIRNRLKIQAAVHNAQVFREVQKEHGSFDAYIWEFVNHRPIRNHWKTLEQLPTKTRESDAMSDALRKRGFKFVGSTICYAFMQAAGLVNDHMVDCYRYRQVQRPVPAARAERRG